MLVTGCDVLGLVGVLTRYDAEGETVSMKKRRVRLHSLAIEFVLGHQLPDVPQPICGVNFLLDRFNVVNLAFVSRPDKSARRVVRMKGGCLLSLDLEDVRVGDL